MEQGSHTVEMTDRRDMTLTGVTDVREFSENRVLLKTSMGELTIRGRNLTISRLNTDTGDLKVSGSIDSLRYSGKAGGSILEGLFK